MKHYFVPGLFLFGTLFFSYLYVVGPPQRGAIRSYEQEESAGGIPYNRLQQFKQEADLKKEIRFQEAEIRKRVPKPELDPGYSKRHKVHEAEINTQLGAAAHELDDSMESEPVNLDQRMDAFLAKRQAYEELEDTKKRLFVKRFIDEAKSMGYHVEVDENLQIKKVKKLGQ